MLQRIREARQDESGFTLIELLIVIVVLGILSSIVVFGLGTFRADANASACSASIKTVGVAADAYNAKVGTFPTAIAPLLPGGLTPAGYVKSDPTVAPNATVATLTFNSGNQTVTGTCP